MWFLKLDCLGVKIMFYKWTLAEIVGPRAASSAHTVDAAPLRVIHLLVFPNKGSKTVSNSVFIKTTLWCSSPASAVRRTLNHSASEKVLVEQTVLPRFKVSTPFHCVWFSCIPQASNCYLCVAREWTRIKLQGLAVRVWVTWWTQLSVNLTLISKWQTSLVLKPAPPAPFSRLCARWQPQQRAVWIFVGSGVYLIILH